jgi:universal stress protein A
MNAVFHHILVPVDFTAKNQAAIEIACQFAHQHDARLTLLHVIEFIDFPDDEELSGFYDKLRSRSEHELEKLVASLGNQSLDVTVDTIINHRSKGIVLYAADNDVDLIVMSSHPFDPDHPGEGWGTISYQVSALCRCSVLLVKQSASGGAPSLSD